MIPSVGRIVLYTSLGDSEGKYPSEQQAAIITKVRDSGDASAMVSEERYTVSLAIFCPTAPVGAPAAGPGLFWVAEVPYSPSFQRGHWTWPPKVG